MLERKSGVALWRQIEAALTESIESGAMPPGDQVPTEQVLSEQFRVNRHTVRRAMAELAEKGLIKVEQGRGTFVRENVVDYLVGRRTRFSEVVSGQSRAPSGKLLFHRPARADAAIADALEMEVGAPLVQMETLGVVDDRPLTVATHLMPSQRFPDFADRYLDLRSISKVFESYDCGDYTRRITKVTARMPDAQESASLDIPRSRPVLVSTSLNVDRHGQPIEYGMTRYAADRCQIVFES